VLYRAAAALAPDDPQRAALAQQAVDLYDRSLALDDDPDVRVNLAVAALLDPRNPMRAVQELQAVLTDNPDHVEANFNMGLMRMQIGRLDAAAESFRRVIALTPADDPVHRRATEALAAVEGAMAQGGASG
jgi:tetratricopeptide (TPR) repeat protein